MRSPPHPHALNHPSRGTSIGSGAGRTNYAASPLFRAAPRTADAGLVEGFAPSLGTQMIIAFVRVQDYPMTVITGLPRDSILAPWRERTRTTLIVTAVPSALLKIDRSFVRDLATSRTDESIVRAIIALAHSVGLLVVAEGVETAEQLRCVCELGCDQWQGFYCCEPQPAARFGQLLKEQTGGTRTGLVAALTR